MGSRGLARSARPPCRARRHSRKRERGQAGDRRGSTSLRHAAARSAKVAPPVAGFPLEDDAMCFCCGQKNPIGLKLEFHETPDGRMGTIWIPRKEHQGFKDIVHGGLVATVLDEV